MLEKNPLCWTSVFLLLTLFVQESSNFMLSHSHSEPQRRFLSRNNLFIPNENIIFKNYAQTFVNFYEEQIMYSATGEGYVDVSEDEDLESNEQKKKEEEKEYAQLYEDDVLNCSLSSSNENDENATNDEGGTVENGNNNPESLETSKSSENPENQENPENPESSENLENPENIEKEEKIIDETNSTANVTENLTEPIDDNIVDDSFNLTDFAYESLDEWEDEENNMNETSNATDENKEEENPFLKTYDESYLNEAIQYLVKACDYSLKS